VMGPLGVETKEDGAGGRVDEVEHRGDVSEESVGLKIEVALGFVG
jgi:hypothetical protein